VSDAKSKGDKGKGKRPPTPKKFPPKASDLTSAEAKRREMLEAVKVYFDVRDRAYWYRLNGRYVSLGSGDLEMHFRALGLSRNNWFESQRETEWPLYRSQVERMIDYAGPLAGHKVGIFQDGSNRKYLITEQAAGVFEEQSNNGVPMPKFFLAFVRELLPDDQSNYFCHWLATALRSLRRGDYRPGQVVCLAGPAGCGKSLLQAIITEVLGGRSANPFRYMMGLTTFNRDLASAEHWMIEDPATTTDIRARRHFGAMLKECTVNQTFSIHQKGKDAISLPIFRRVSISVNNEPENLAVVPPLDPSIIDKVFLFNCAMVKVAFDPYRSVDGTRSLLPETQNDGELDRVKLWRDVRNEIPLIRAWLLKNFRVVPVAVRDDRFGVAAWHHPDLLSELCALAPETRLLQLIDHVCFEKATPTPWVGKSIDLEAEMRGSKFAFECEKLLRFNGACGTYLGKLARNHPKRVRKETKDGYTVWTIATPKGELPTHESKEVF